MIDPSKDLMLQIEAEKSKASKKITEIKSHVSNWVTYVRIPLIAKYRAPDYEQLKNVYGIYRQTIFKSTDPTTPTNTVLDIDWAGKKPVAQEREINACLEAVSENTKYTGEMGKYFLTLAQFIKLCIEVNLNREKSSQYTYFDSAAILFCVEMYKFSTDSMDRGVDKDFLADIKRRIDYLRELEKKQILYIKGDSDYTVHILVYNLRTLLEGEILPQMQTILSKRSAREHFKDLNMNLERALNQLTKSVFYWFTDDPKAVEQFSSVAIASRSTLLLNQSLKSTLQTNFGQMFAALADSMQITSSNLFQDQQSFLNGHGICAENVLSCITQPNSKSGVHALFSDPEAQSLLLDAMGLINELGLLVKTFIQAYELTGEGGNLLLYLALCNEVNELMESYLLVVEMVDACFKKLSRRCDALYYQLFISKKRDFWMTHHHEAKSLYEGALESLTENKQIIEQIFSQMIKMRSPDYKREFDEKIAAFQKLVGTVALRMKQRNNLSHLPPKTIQQFKNLPPAFTSKLLPIASPNEGPKTAPSSIFKKPSEPQNEKKIHKIMLSTLKTYLTKSDKPALDEAQRLTEELSKLNSDDREIVFVIGLSRMKFGYYNDAITCFSNILKQNPNDTDAKQHFEKAIEAKSALAFSPTLTKK